MPVEIEYGDIDEYASAEKIKDLIALPLMPEEDSIEIDRAKIELVLGIDGKPKKYPLLAIRKGFKNFNTPAGEFKAGYMNENHLSSLFDVWMPYSIQFSGDYFLHGYPTYNDPERTPVPYGTSGGCIRMDTADMKEIYEQVKWGMPINIK